MIGDIIKSRFIPVLFLGVGLHTEATPRQERIEWTSHEIEHSLQIWSGGSIRRLPKVQISRFQAFINSRLVRLDRSKSSLAPPNMVFANGGDAYVWPFSSTHQNYYLILLNPYAVFVPSAEHAWLFVVNQQGTVLGHDDFDIGYRMHAKRASFGPVKWLSTNVLVQETQPRMSSESPLRILIAFDGLRPATIGLEKPDQHLSRMPYFAPDCAVGPACHPYSLASLESALTVGNTVQKLEALTWLNGSHSRVSGNQEGLEHEPIESQEGIESAMKSSKIAAIMTDLRHNKNIRIRDLAASISSH